VRKHPIKYRSMLVSCKPRTYELSHRRVQYLESSTEEHKAFITGSFLRDIQIMIILDLCSVKIAGVLRQLRI